MENWQLIQKDAGKGKRALRKTKGQSALLFWPGENAETYFGFYSLRFLRSVSYRAFSHLVHVQLGDV